MATVELLFPKGEEVGFKVPSTHVDIFRDVMDILHDEDKFMSFEAQSLGHVQVGEIAVEVERSRFTYSSKEYGIRSVELIHGLYCHYYEGLICCESDAFWESRGFIEHEGKMYESAESLSALQLRGSIREKFNQVLDWCEENGMSFVSFGLDDDSHSNVILNINGQDTDPMGYNDYLIAAPRGVEVHTKDSLIEEGYIIVNDEV